MKRSYKIAAVLLLLVIGVFLFRTCTVKKLLWSGTYDLARSRNWTSLIEYSRQKNLQAFMQDFIQLMTKEGDLKFNIAIINENNLIPDLDDGDYDGVFSSLQADRYNQNIYLFSEPILLVGPVLIVSERSDITSLKDMDGKILGVGSESDLEKGHAYYPNLAIKLYESTAAMVEDIRKGQIDGAVIPVQDAWSYTRGIYKGALKVVTDPLTDNGLRLIAKRDEDGKELIDLFNAGLDHIKEENAYLDLLRKWDLL